MAEQINIFVENKPGRLMAITRILKEASVNIRAIEIADREHYGIVKILVDDPRKAQITLAEQGFACALKKVLAVVMKDKPGGLFSLAELFSEKNVNIIDAYGFVIESKKEAVLCVEVKEYDTAVTVIQEGGFRVLSDKELYDL